MRDYKPQMSFPRGWTPRDIFAIPIETPRKIEPPTQIIPDHVKAIRYQFGASSHAPLPGHNNKFGADLAASASRGGARARKRRKSGGGNDHLFRHDPHAHTQNMVLAYLTDTKTAWTAREISEAHGLTRDSIKTCLARLVHRGIIKHRRYSIRQKSGHQAQYILAEIDWPPYPPGARYLGGEATA